MKNLFLWYLPQAFLLLWGVWFAANAEPPIGGLGGFGLGLMLAAAYTAAVMVVRDSPSHLRGISPQARIVFRALFALFFLAGILAAAASAKNTGNAQSVALAFVGTLSILYLIWAVALGLWHSFTVRSRPSPAGRLPEAEVLPPVPSRLSPLSRGPGTPGAPSGR